ncbi:MAG: Stk1 family PASTA domain-containing Ser/Thr kinase [Bacillota bacterium]|nr:Stk1 family PASTA domain-containing Ser/Thr kinase [Bacillota bacterium]
MTGRILSSKYEIIKELAVGGMSRVYLAKNLATDASVAVKILKRELQEDEKFLRRFRREAQASMTLSHPNIVKMYDIGRDGEDYYLVMEYIPRTLKDLIRENGTLTHREAVRIATQVCDALKTAHAMGIIHGDIKPQNILITENGTAKVTDFGIARDISSHTKTQEAAGALGSVHYISPEQANGHQAERISDIYSLGITLFEMITGDMPFKAETGVAVALKHVSAPLPRPKDINATVPRALNDIVLKATQKARHSRYQSADALKKDLLRSLREPNGNFAKIGEESPTLKFSSLFEKHGESGTVKQPDPKKRLRRILLITLSSTLALAVVLISVFVTQSTLFNDLNNQSLGVMPHLAGVIESEAVALLAEREINYEIVRQADDNVPEGIVISQTPDQLATIKQSEIASIVISLGPESMVMPDLVGMTWAAAEETIEESGLVAGPTDYRSSNGPDGYVLDQDPKPDATVSRGDTVYLWVSGIGNPAVSVMPSVTGISLDEAKDTLNEAGFKLIRVYEEESQQFAGEVIKQQPEANTTLTPSSVYVELKISKQVSKSYHASVSIKVSVEQAKSWVLIVLLENDLEYVLYTKDHSRGETTIPLEAYSFTPSEKEIKIFVNGRETDTTETIFILRSAQ